MQLKLNSRSDLLELYFKSKQNAWALTTLKVEYMRLNKYQGLIHTLNPERLFNNLKANGVKPYTILTVFTRVIGYIDWLIEENFITTSSWNASIINPFKKWKKTNARLFKNVYTPRVTEVSFKEANERINSIRNKAVKNHLKFILNNGLRYHDSVHWTESEAGERIWYVTGKGGKKRRIFGTPPKDRVAYHVLYRNLKKIGLRPHDLRKIFLNEAINKGARIEDIKELAGWSSITTADSYIRANDGRLANIVRAIHGSGKEFSTGI